MPVQFPCNLCHKMQTSKKIYCIIEKFTIHDKFAKYHSLSFAA